MKYLVQPTDNNRFITHTRDSDGATINVREFPDTVNVQTLAPVFTSLEGFTPIPPLVSEPQLPTQADCIALGKQHVTNSGYGADEKVICLNKLLKVKDQNALASYPKLVAVYTWLETVQAMAVAGQTTFPPAPHTFEEVVSE